jgi:prepilin-type processing-associated H-X9-DG protein
VIAIIAILASMLLPALTRARDMATSLHCKANQKQFGIAFVVYAGDFDNWIPARGYSSRTFQGFGPGNFMTVLGVMGYIGGAETFVGKEYGNTRIRFAISACPGEPGTDWDNNVAGAGLDGSTYFDYDHLAGSYVMNQSLGLSNWVNPRQGFLTRSLPNEDIVGATFSPSGARLMTDTPDWASWHVQPRMGDKIDTFGWNRDTRGVAQFDYMYRHPSTTANFLYFDGHVKSHRPIWLAGGDNLFQNFYVAATSGPTEGTDMYD